ncbi:MAG: hydroxyacid dehydrogenase [Alphaproteobacteria bacterium]|nr:hydroxyacid dehydrogenase [Alphaproteobacteria bacterium]MCB9929740.1 hydroxyacid dehydrogenase [Alphaproteobacteria bacterium]
MTANIAKLVIFDTWMAGKAMDMLRASDVIDLCHLQQADGLAANEPHLLSMHGYQSLPRTELQKDYLTNADFIARMPNLLAVASTGAGYDMIDVDACTEAGVIVVNQSGANKEAVAEHAFGLILGLSKKIAQADRGMRETDMFNRRTVTGNDILGKTLGVVGLGQIGTRSAEIAKAFRMRVIAYDPYVSAGECQARGAEKVDWETLFGESDFITVHCPRSAETLGMIDAAAFALMKPSAYFVNTARGGIHKEDDLLQALEAGRLAGAGLDVWWEEPTPKDHPLLQRNDVIATPHSAGVTHEAVTNMREWAASQWIEIFQGKVPPRLINPEVWPKYQQRFAEKLGFTPEPLKG